jgi:hypothetical protein
MDENIIKLNIDSKEVCLKALKDMNGQIGFFYDLIKKDQLTEEMRDNLSSLFEYSMSDLSKQTGYDSNSAKKVEEKHAEIRNLNLKIRELEEKLGSDDITDKVSAQIKHLTDLVEKWWDIDGFKYIREIFVRPYGTLEITFGFSFNDFSSSYSDKPITVKEKHKSWIEEVQERGFRLINSNRDVNLIDDDHNRKLLAELIKNRFPSAKILQWENYAVYKTDKFQLRSVNVLIKELREVKALEEYVSKFHEIDEE